MSDSNFIVSGSKSDNDLHTETLGKYFIDNLRKRSMDEFIYVDAITKEVQTCGNLLEEVAKAVRLFINLNLQRGDVVAIICENSVGYSVPILAAWLLGVNANPLNPDYTIGELRHALLISKPKVILCSEKVIEIINQLKPELQFLQEIFLYGAKSCNLETLSVERFENLLKDVSVDEYLLNSADLDVSKTAALILLSSGTTGLPKGVVLTHKNLRSIFEFYCEPNFCGIEDSDTQIGVLPFYHIYGLIFYCGPMLVSTTLIILKKFNPQIFLQTIQDYKANKLQLVPPLVLFLAKSPLVSDYDLSSIEDILCGAAAIGQETKDEVIKRIGNVTFRTVYGATEATGGFTFLYKNNEKANSVGKIFPNLKAKVCDLTTGKKVGPMKAGELCFKGSTIMYGYVNIPNDCTVIDEEGFYHSGDVGYYDHDGYFYIVDRLKELIKYKGFQVAPAELENILVTHPAVRDCGVIGKPDERAGQLPLAYVVAKPGVTVTEQELIDYVAERISSTKRLYGGVRFIEEIPKNATGKILRKKLETLLKENP